MDKNGDVICYPFGDITTEEELASRIVAAVNATAGMPDPVAALEAMRAAIREAHTALSLFLEWQVHLSEDAKITWVHDQKKATAALGKLQPFLL